LPCRNILKGTLFLAFIVNALYLPSTSEAATIWDKRKQAVEDIIEPQETKEEIEAEADIAKKVIQGLEFEETGTIDPSDIFIPDQYGTIIERYKGTNGKLIVHIQDAHANYEGQRNLASILEVLITDYNLKLILREGRSQNVNLSHLRDYGFPEARERVADEYLKKARITGEEYLELTTDYPITYGDLEEKTLYEAHKEALWEIDKFKDLAAEYIGKMIAVANGLKPDIYNEELVEFNEKKTDYDSENIDLLSYYEYLYNKAEEKDIPLYTFPNFQSLMKANNIEKQIDLVKIRSGEASSEDTALYAEYLDLTRDLNINALFKEEPLLEDFVVDVLTENSDQKKLLRISKALSIMKNLLRVKVVPEEYKYFADNKKDFAPGLWTGFIQEKLESLNLDLDIPVNISIISDNLPKVEKFYEIAFERDSIFLKKTEEHVNNKGVNIAALVAGGFHTPTLTKLLEDKGYSYVVVSPKVTTETDEELYRKVLSE